MQKSSHYLDKFQRFVKEFVQPTQEEWDVMAQRLQIKHLSKKSLLLQQGQVCQFVAFVNKGLFRAYKLIDGKEVTHYFPIEGFFATDYASFLQNRYVGYAKELSIL